MSETLRVRKSRRVGWGGSLLGLLILAGLGAPVAAVEGGFSAQQKSVDPTTVIAGQVNLERLKETYPQGVVLVDLRTEAEGTDAEAAAAAELGIDYVNIPVAGARIDPGQVEQLRRILDNRPADVPVVVHCASGNRASMLWGAVKVSEGASLASVEAALDGILTKEPARQALIEYARTAAGGQADP